MMTPYKQRAYQQVKSWVNGVWLHNKVDDECTPDFGCCKPALKETNMNKRFTYAMQWRKRNGVTMSDVN